MDVNLFANCMNLLRSVVRSFVVWTCLKITCVVVPATVMNFDPSTLYGILTLHMQVQAIINSYLFPLEKSSIHTLPNMHSGFWNYRRVSLTVYLLLMVLCGNKCVWFGLDFSVTCLLRPPWQVEADT